MAELKFEEPEPIKSRVSNATEQMLLTMHRLKEHQGKWALIGEWEGQSGAYSGKKTIERALKENRVRGNYELTIRRESYNAAGKGEGGSKLYARFVGNSQAP